MGEEANACFSGLDSGLNHGVAIPKRHSGGVDLSPLTR